MLGEKDGRSTVRRLSQTTASGSNGSLNAIFEKEVIQSCNTGHWAGIWQLCAFASISGHPVRSIYPAKNALVRTDLHRTIAPRPSRQTGIEEYKIMWTKIGCYGKQNLQGWWKPNHFVPCVKRDLLQTLNERKATSKDDLPAGSDTTTNHKQRYLTLADFIVVRKDKKNKKKKHENARETETIENTAFVHSNQNSSPSRCSQEAGAKMAKNKLNEDKMMFSTTSSKGVRPDSLLNSSTSQEEKSITLADFLAKREDHTIKSSKQRATSNDRGSSDSREKDISPVGSILRHTCMNSRTTEWKSELPRQCNTETATAAEKQTTVTTANTSNRHQQTTVTTANIPNRHQQTTVTTANISNRHQQGLQRIKTSDDGALLVTSAKRAERTKKKTEVKMENIRDYFKPIANISTECDQKSVKPDQLQDAHKKDNVCQQLYVEPNMLPLSVRKRWYRKYGEALSSNRSRALNRDNAIIMENDSMVGIQRSTIKESLKESSERLTVLMDTCPRPSIKKYANLAAVKAVCTELTESPILSTQKASSVYQTTKHRILGDNEGDIVKRTAMQTYETLSKYMSIMQVYIHQNAYIMEDRGDKLANVVEDIYNLTTSQNFQQVINKHVEDKIGHLYKHALEYLDSERDRDTVTCLLTKITSVTFMANLEGVKNRKRIQKARDIVPAHIKAYQDIIAKFKCKENQTTSQQKAVLRKVKELKKKGDLRHSMSGRGRALKCEQNPNLVPVLEYEFGFGDFEERGGGGMEAHPRLTSGILYKAADNKTTMAHARETILATGPKDFSISLSSCYNYTQNYKKGTYEAKRHHEGKGVNAMISLHRAPKTAVVKDTVINAHYCSAAINF